MPQIPAEPEWIDRFFVHLGKISNMTPEEASRHASRIGMDSQERDPKEAAEGHAKLLAGLESVDRGTSLSGRLRFELEGFGDEELQRAEVAAQAVLALHGVSIEEGYRASVAFEHWVAASFDQGLALSEPQSAANGAWLDAHRSAIAVVTGEWPDLLVGRLQA